MYMMLQDNENSEFDKHLPDTDILITTPFHPGYLTPQREYRKGI